MTISPQLIQLILNHKRTIQDKLLQTQVSMFQTVCLILLLNQDKAVRCIVHQLRIFLLSPPLSSPVRQVVMEEPFTFPIQIIDKVFYMKSVVMIVAQQIATISSLRIYKLKMPPRARIMSIIRHLHVV